MRAGQAVGFGSSEVSNHPGCPGFFSLESSMLGFWVFLNVPFCGDSPFGEATSNKCHASSNKCLTSSNKKLLETSALLLVTIISFLGNRIHTTTPGEGLQRHQGLWLHQRAGCAAGPRSNGHSRAAREDDPMVLRRVW